MSHCLVQIFLSMVFYWNIHCLQGQDCEYRYVIQPPTELRCNPYDTINQFTLTCSVEGPPSPGFSVAWFRRMNNRNTTELQTSQPGVAIKLASSINIGAETPIVNYSSEITVSRLDETNDVGDYWCQVRLMNRTSFVEKSNILSLANERRYMEFSRCTGSQSINREDCLRMLNITVPVVTGGNIQTTTESEVVTSFLSDLSLTNTESEVVTIFLSELSLTNTESEVVTSFFSDLSLTTQSSAGPVGKNINLPIIYTSVGCTMIILIILLSICTVTIVFLRKYKLKTNGNSRPDKQANFTDNVTHELESLPVNSNQNEGFDYKENIAYAKVCPVILNENISYSPIDSHRFTPLYEEIDDARVSAWHTSMAYGQ